VGWEKWGGTGTEERSLQNRNKKTPKRGAGNLLDKTGKNDRWESTGPGRSAGFPMERLNERGRAASLLCKPLLPRSSEGHPKPKQPLGRISRN